MLATKVAGRHEERRREVIHMITVRVFDNKGKSWDRYTVEIIDDNDVAYFGMSENAQAPMASISTVAIM